MSILSNIIIRNDSEGSGEYLSSRGSRKHYGVDFVVSKGQEVFAPEDGVLVRIAYPDANDLRKEGFLFKGNSGVEFKVFYCSPISSMIGDSISKGTTIAIAQSVSELYGLPNMTDHIHVETRRDGSRFNPMDYFNQKKKSCCCCCCCSQS